MIQKMQCDFNFSVLTYSSITCLNPGYLKSTMHLLFQQILLWITPLNTNSYRILDLFLESKLKIEFKQSLEFASKLPRPHYSLVITKKLSQKSKKNAKKPYNCETNSRIRHLKTLISPKFTLKKMQKNMHHLYNTLGRHFMIQDLDDKQHSSRRRRKHKQRRLKKRKQQPHAALQSQNQKPLHEGLSLYLLVDSTRNNSPCPDGAQTKEIERLIWRLLIIRNVEVVVDHDHLGKVNLYNLKRLNSNHSTVKFPGM